MLLVQFYHTFSQSCVVRATKLRLKTLTVKPDGRDKRYSCRKLAFRSLEPEHVGQYVCSQWNSKCKQLSLWVHLDHLFNYICAVILRKGWIQLGCLQFCSSEASMVYEHNIEASVVCFIHNVGDVKSNSIACKSWNEEHQGSFWFRITYFIDAFVKFEFNHDLSFIFQRHYLELTYSIFSAKTASVYLFFELAEDSLPVSAEKSGTGNQRRPERLLAL